MRLGIGLSSLGAEVISPKRLEASLLSTGPVPSSRKPSRNLGRNLVLKLGVGREVPVRFFQAKGTITLEGSSPRT